MRSLHAVLLLLVLLVVSADSVAQQWQKISTIDEVYALYPERIESLLESLDLNHAGLEKTDAAFKRKDAVAACEELLTYYTHANTSSHLRRKLPAESTTRKGVADSILQDFYKFYELVDKVPRKSDGRLDWSHDGPDDDIEWAWGLNRHGHLSILLEAYFETGNPEYAKRIDNHLQDWVVSSLPYPRAKSSTAMWRGLEVALRVKVWARVFFGLINSPHLSAATRILLLTSIPEHTHYMRNFHAKAGNWLTMEMSGLAMVATAWPEFREAPDWVSYAKDKMLEGLRDQVYPDGVQKELTSHYHQVALHNFKLFLDICKEAKEPLPEEYVGALEKMNNYVAYSVSPTGYGILNNDSDHRYNRDIIAETARAYGREDWMFIASNGKKGTRPAGSPSVVFPWAGQVIMRSDYDADAHWAFFDAGPWGTGHQHNDKLHLSVTAYGREILVDGGRFAYRGELARKFRQYATGSASHNVVLIDGRGQDAGPTVASQPFQDSRYKITDRFDYVSASIDRFKEVEGKINHNRSIFYIRGKFWIVVDQIESDRPRQIETLWHWHPGSIVQIGANDVASTAHEKGNLAVIPVGYDQWNVKQVKGQERPLQGWYSERYNMAQPSPTTIYSTDIKGTSTFVWVLQPSLGTAMPVNATIISADGEKVRISVKDERLNEWDVNVPFNNSALASYTFRSSLEESIHNSRLDDVDNAKALLSRLDLDRPGMEAVRASASNPEKAITALLTYYRERSTVKHPVDRSKRTTMLGNAADDDDIREADDALHHIFVGQSAYPPYYCGDDIKWGFKPVPDNEWVWQLNRMDFWDALGRAYWHTGDEKYAREWTVQLVDWTRKNPRDEAHAYSWRSIEAGIRGYRWTGLFQRFIDSPAFTEEVLVAFLNSCYDHAAYLMTKYRKGSNWALMEAEGMAFIAMTFPEFRDALDWRTEAISRLNAEIDNQVHPDGHQRELAAGYHTGSIGWFKRTLDLAEINGLTSVFPDEYSKTIEKMCEVPFKLGMPDGTTTQFGDSWQGLPGHIWPRLREWATLFDREDFLYVATQGKEGKKPHATAFAFENSGLYSMRSDWNKEAICLVLKCGPDGGGHCQPDNGTFELYAGGRNLMPDAGSFIYHGDPEGRAWFRQTKVHQTLTLNGGNSAYAPRLLRWKPGKDLDLLVVENASYPGLTHRRAVFFVDKQYFIIVDEAIGLDTGDVDLHFQLVPGKAVFDNKQMSVRSNFTEGWNVLVQSNFQDGMQLEEEEGWVSFLYTRKEPRPAFRYRLKKDSAEGLRFVTIVAPYEGTIPPKITAKLKKQVKPGSPKIRIVVDKDGVRRRIGYEIGR